MEKNKHGFKKRYILELYKRFVNFLIILVLDEIASRPRRPKFQWKDRSNEMLCELRQKIS